jgi:non-homologous end joining protein Ku
MDSGFNQDMGYQIMAKPMIKIVNAETGEEIEREMNAEEYAQYGADIVELEKKELAKIEHETAKAALLTKLGITAEEAAILLG